MITIQKMMKQPALFLMVGIVNSANVTATEARGIRVVTVSISGSHARCRP